MERKHILIIVAILAVLAAAGAYFMFSDPMTLEHSTMELSESSYMKVPVDPSAVSKADEDGVFYYFDKNNGINITSCTNLTSDDGVKTLNNLKNDVEVGSKKITEGNAVIYAKNGVYSIFVKNTKYNGSVLIQSTDKNLLLKCWDSLKFHSPTDSLKIEDSGSKSVVNATKTTENAVSSSSKTTTTTTKVTKSSSSSGRSIEDDFGPSSSTKSYKKTSSQKKSSTKKSTGSIEDDF